MAFVVSVQKYVSWFKVMVPSPPLYHFEKTYFWSWSSFEKCLSR
jgi:hypothetical protein